MQVIKNIGNICLLVAITAAAVTLIGMVFRAYQTLFCIGYGC